MLGQVSTLWKRCTVLRQSRYKVIANDVEHAGSTAKNNGCGVSPEKVALSKNKKPASIHWPVATVMLSTGLD